MLNVTIGNEGPRQQNKREQSFAWSSCKRKRDCTGGCADLLLDMTMREREITPTIGWYE